MIALLAVALVAAPAEARRKPRCHGKKATIVGTNGADRIRAPRYGRQVIVARAGNDVIRARHHSDLVCGNAGNDRIFPGPRTDRVKGGPGKDFVEDTYGDDVLRGQRGNDTLVGGFNSDRLLGGPGNDTLVGNESKDALNGAGGADKLIGGPGGDGLFGGNDADTLSGGSGTENAFGGSGGDRIYGELHDDNLFGEEGADLIVGSHGIDAMRGGGGNDFLRGGTNIDAYIGEGGTDTASFMSAMPDGTLRQGRDGVIISLAEGFANGSGGRDRISGVENALGSGFNDLLIGTGGANRLDGGPGMDRLEGVGGPDSLIGGIQRDTCDDDDADPVVECENQDHDDNDPARPTEAHAYLDPLGPDPGVVVHGIPGNLLQGTNDNLTVTPQGTTIRVSSPVAPVVGVGTRCGTDSSSDPDSAVCRLPATTLGYLTFWGGLGTDKLTVARGLPLMATTDIDGGAGNDTVSGSPLAEVIFSGQSGDDVLRGGGGADALIAEGSGSDDLFADEGHDQLATDDPCQGHVFRGGAGYDIAGFGRYEHAIAGGGGVTATLGGTATDPSRNQCSATSLAGDLEILEGSAGPDVLTGTGGGDPLILGREGDDEIHGLGGRDQLTGGNGADSLFGEGGFDSLDAQDGAADKALDCGANGGKAARDPSDPPAVACRR